MADEEKKDRAKPQPRGFMIELGTAADVAAAGALGKFAEIETKSELEARFADWIAVQPADLVAGFLAHLKRLAQEKLDGMGPKPATVAAPTSEAAEHLEFLKEVSRSGGIPIAGPEEGE